MDAIVQYFQNNLWIRLVVDGYLLLIIAILLGQFIFKNRRALDFTIMELVIILIAYISKSLNLKVSKWLFFYLAVALPIFAVVALAPDIRRMISPKIKADSKHEVFTSSNQETKKAIIDAVLFLSSRKIGALITIEKNISLDQYAEKAISLNSDVTKELLINIFTPLTPLHDGGVIIRGNKIRCAGAYYVLAQKTDNLDKTTGSRHRAGIGISEVSDSLTIICSEETGGISLAIEGILIKANEREKIQEYLDMFLK
ncbi:MAG: diadenylate cyclase CdaA [Anaeroplasmataceae bacterium]